MSADDIHSLLVVAGRVSLGAFLLLLFFSGTRPWLIFISALTALFATVSAFAYAGGGQNLFPGGRSLADVGGWPSLLGIFVLCYALAFLGLRAARAGEAASGRLRIAGLVSTTMFAFMYFSTYLPLVSVSSWFVAPIIVLSAALGAHYSRQAPRLRRHFT